MSNYPSIRFLVMTTLLACVGGCSNQRAQHPPAEAAQSRGSNIQEYRYRELHQVEDFSFTERDGSTFSQRDLQGKIWVASFFFSSCKFECSDQNRTLRDEVHEKLAGLDFTLVSITCDPAHDNTDVLQQYATEFTTHPKKWKFLTGSLSAIQAMGERSFKVIVEPTSHSKRLLLVDKWGRFRDSFEWKEKEDLKRLLKTAKMLSAETSQPKPDETVKTRALPASVFQLESGSAPITSAHSQANKENSSSSPDWPSWRKEEWLTSFELTDTSNKTFRSTQLKGKVWIANFFFSSCTGACPRLLGQIQELRQQIGEREVTFVSISNDPDRDTPRVLKDYSRKFGADDRWFFLTGEKPLHIRAIGSEYFGVNAGFGETHSEKLTVVDKKGKVRGHFDYNRPKEIIDLRLLIDDLIAEN